MDLYILRHAIAGVRKAPTPVADSLRPLTVEGAEKMRRIARGLKAMDLSFDLVLSSPFVRAKQTAEILVNVFGQKEKLEFSPALAANGNPQELVDELKRSHRKRESIVLVGHEPYLTRLISVLISGGTSLPMTLRKGGVCKLAIESLQYGRCATLEWLLTPRQLRQIR